MDQFIKKILICLFFYTLLYSYSSYSIEKPKILSGDNVIVVMAPGFLTNSPAGKLYAKKHGGLFGNFKSYFDALDVPYEILIFSTQSGPKVTKKQIKNRLEDLIVNQKKEIIIIGHSKGALDLMLTLIDNKIFNQKLGV